MENTHIALRFRPFNQNEINRNDKIVWQIDSNNVQLNLKMENNQISQKSQYQNVSFNFDYCFNQEMENNYIYERCIRKIVLSSLNGINGSIFMYGQSGSGKTFTMMGYDKKLRKNYNFQQQQSGNASVNIFHNSNLLQQDEQEEDIDMFSFKTERHQKNMGVLIISLHDLLDKIQKDLEKTYILRCSYIEIYNDQIYDLLKPPNELAESLSINQDSNNHQFYIKGIQQESVSNLQEIFEVLRRGEFNRHYAQTKLNHKSSRSHTIFRLIVQSMTNSFIKVYRKKNYQQQIQNVNNDELISSIQRMKDYQQINDQDTVIMESELNFIDLAGSERASTHTQQESNINNFVGNKYNYQDIIQERVKEGQYINKSLFFLTQVVLMRSEGKPSNQIPYRNSPITKILKSSLSGNARTLFILCATPSSKHLEQTISTMRFGMSAKKVEYKIYVNIQTKSNDEAFKLMVSDYEKRIKDLEEARNGDKKMIQYLRQDIEEAINYKIILEHQLTVEINKVKFENLTNQQNLALFNTIKQQPLNQLPNIQYWRNQTWFNDNIGLIFQTKNNINCQSFPNNLKKEWQELIYDFEGKFALQALKRAKQINDGMDQKMKEIVELVNQIIINHEQTQKEFGNSILQKQIKDIQLNAQKLLNINQILYDSKQEKEKRLSLLEQQEGLQELSDEQLNQLENKVEKTYNSIRDEKARRKYEHQFKEFAKANGLIFNGFNSQSENKQQQKLKELDQLQINLTANDFVLDMQWLECKQAAQLDHLNKIKDLFEKSIKNNLTQSIELKNLESDFIKKLTSENKIQKQKEFPDLFVPENQIQSQQNSLCQSIGEGVLQLQNNIDYNKQSSIKQNKQLEFEKEEYQGQESINSECLTQAKCEVDISRFVEDINYQKVQTDFNSVMVPVQLKQIIKSATIQKNDNQQHILRQRCQSQNSNPTLQMEDELINDDFELSITEQVDQMSLDQQNAGEIKKKNQKRKQQQQVILSKNSKDIIDKEVDEIVEQNLSDQEQSIHYINKSAYSSLNMSPFQETGVERVNTYSDFSNEKPCSDFNKSVNCNNHNSSFNSNNQIQDRCGVKKIINQLVLRKANSIQNQKQNCSSDHQKAWCSSARKCENSSNKKKESKQKKGINSSFSYMESASKAASSNAPTSTLIDEEYNQRIRNKNISNSQILSPKHNNNQSEIKENNNKLIDLSNALLYVKSSMQNRINKARTPQKTNNIINQNIMMNQHLNQQNLLTLNQYLQESQNLLQENKFQDNTTFPATQNSLKKDRGCMQQVTNWIK